MVMTVTEHIRRRLLKGVREEQTPKVSIPEMRRSQWSEEFERLMRNRMTVGGYRYGRIHQQTEVTVRFDNIGSIITRAERYRRDGNKEHLVDIANLALIEFVLGNCHPSPHFTSVDDGYHTEPLQEDPK